MSDPRWLLDQAGKPCGYDGRGTTPRLAPPSQRIEVRTYPIGAEEALEVWAAMSGGRLKSHRKRKGALGEGLDWGYLVALHVERFWADVGPARRWAPLVTIANARPPARKMERVTQARPWMLYWVVWGWRDASLSRFWLRTLDAGSVTVLESWQFALFRLGGYAEGGAVKDWDFQGLAEILTGLVTIRLRDWLEMNPFAVPVEIDEAA